MDRKLTLKRIQCLVVEYSLCRCISGKSYESQETSEDVCVSSFRPVHRVVHWGADGKESRYFSRAILIAPSDPIYIWKD